MSLRTRYRIVYDQRSYQSCCGVLGTMKRPSTLTELLSSPFGQDFRRGRTIKADMREILLKKMRQNDPIFSGVKGYEACVTPQIVIAILSRHNMILLGLRGQAKSRILRSLTDFL